MISETNKTTTVKYYDNKLVRTQYDMTFSDFGKSHRNICVEKMGNNALYGCAQCEFTYITYNTTSGR